MFARLPRAHTGRGAPPEGPGPSGGIWGPPRPAGREGAGPQSVRDAPPTWMRVREPECHGVERERERARARAGELY